MRSFLLALLLIVAFVHAQSQTQNKTPGSNVDDAKAAAQVVQSLFAAMKAKDAQAISSLFIKDGQLVAIDKPRTGDGPSTTRLFTGDAFAKLISESKAADFIEEMKDPEVKVFGDMAIVFGRYTFHVGEKFSHCGTNSFHLVRTPDGWKIANAASTLEFNCNP
jgi:ketosteroid isomerase-like protein